MKNSYKKFISAIENKLGENISSILQKCPSVLIMDSENRCKKPVSFYFSSPTIITHEQVEKELDSALKD